MKKKPKKISASDIIKEIEQEDLNKQRDILDKQEIGVIDKPISDDFDLELSSNEPNRELFTAKNIRFKTQLTEEQRGAVSILYHAYEQCVLRGINFSGLKHVLDEYIDFGVSVDRKSRSEFVDAQKAQVYNQQQNMLNQNKTNMENMKV